MKRISAKERLLTAERLKEVLDYDPATGVFRWRKRTSNRVSVGHIAGEIDRHGHRNISIDKSRYGAHRLAWLYVHGRWPEPEIDHINRIKDDNRIANLREATRNQNNRNVGRKSHNTSGYKGVVWHDGAQKWAATIVVNKRNIYLGLFTDPAIAHAAYAAASTKYHGEFGRPD